MEVGLIFGIVLGIICAVIASSKERSGFGWFLLGFFFGFFALIAVCIASDHKGQRLKEESAARERRRLQERLRQEQIKNQSLHQTVDARLDVHDKALNLDTRPPAALATVAEKELDYPAIQDEFIDGWYFSVDGEQQGPVDQAIIKQLKKNGILTEVSLVFKKGMEQWQPLSSIPELIYE